MTQVEQLAPIQEQRFIVPGHHSWQRFKALQALLAEPGVRLSYLDGCVELMTTGEDHELIKKAIAILLEIYFFQMGIEFIPVGNATREAETKGASFDPDESYYLREKKAQPDLAIEVIGVPSGSRGSTGKLERYKRFGIPEVWFWEDNQLSLYRLRDQDYELISRSELLPELDIALLVRCVLIPSRLEARAEFLKAIRQ